MNTDHPAPDQPRPLRWRAAVAVTAGLLGTGVALTAIAAAAGGPSPVQLAGVHEDQPGPCDEAEHAGDPRCTGATTPSTADDTPTSVDVTAPANAVPDGTTKTIDAAPAGTVVVTVADGKLVVTSATPNDGWTLGEQRSAGREVEVRFLSATQRVDVKAELEDGQIRTRVRVRDLTPGTSSTVPGDDRSGSGRGGADDPANHDVGDDHSGHGADDPADHDLGDDHGGGDRSGHDAGDDHGGSSGSGSSGSGRDHPED